MIGYSVMVTRDNGENMLFEYSSSDAAIVQFANEIRQMHWRSPDREDIRKVAIYVDMQLLATVTKD